MRSYYPPRQFKTTAQRGYGSRHQRRARAAIAAHPFCSWCGVTEDLCADHVVPLAAGGDPLGRLRVLCRRCNSSRGSGDPRNPKTWQRRMEPRSRDS